MEDFNEFSTFVSLHTNELNAMDGNCKTCPQKKVCLSSHKSNIIYSVLSLNEKASRVPGLLRFVKKNKWVLNVVPARIYKKIYGLHSYNLPCPFIAKTIYENLDKIETVYNMFTDDLSKKIFLGILMYRLTFDKRYIIDCNEYENQYFLPEFSGLGNEEVFVDCGAYIGDTLESYLEHNAYPKKCYLFEPDANNAQKLKEVIKSKDMVEHCTIIEKGVYERTTKLWFVSGKGSGSYFSTEETEGAQSIDVTSVDDCVDEPATFIKTDIEGFEQSALIGAKSQIEKNKPKLAICVYHSVEDLWEIPIMINDFGVYANLKLRHYSDNFRESVFYAF